MKIFSNIKVKYKLLILILSLSLPIAFVSYLFAMEEMRIISARKLELSGIEYQALVRPVLEGVGMHRSLVAEYLGGNEEVLQDIKQAGLDIQSSFALLNGFSTEWSDEKKLKEDLNRIESHWQSLQSESLKMRKRESFNAHSELTKDVLKHMKYATNRSNLKLDPDLDIAYMVEFTMLELPYYMDELSKLSSSIKDITARRYLEDGEGLLITTYQLNIKRIEDEIIASMQGAFENNTEIKNLAEKKLNEFIASLESFEKSTEVLVKDVTVLMQADWAKYSGLSDQAFGLGGDMYELLIPKMKELIDHRANLLQEKMYFSAAIAAALYVVAFLLFALISKDFKSNFSRIISLFKKIEEGKYNSEIDCKGNTEFSNIFKSLESMQANLKDSIESEQELAAVNRRIKRALDKVNTSVMMVNNELEVLYVNEAAEEMFKSVEEDIKQDVENFNSEKLIGSNVLSLYKDSEEHEEKLKSLECRDIEELVLGPRTFRITSNPVFNKDKERIGTVLEWKDRTLQLATEADVQSIVNGALAGDLSKRINLEDKFGFFERLGTSVNNLVDMSERVVNDTVRVLGALADGNLSERIENEYEGAFGTLKNDANSVVNKLTEVTESIKNSSNSVDQSASEINQGNLNLSNRTEQQAASLEETSSSMEEMTATVQQNAENAQKANALAISSCEQAESGGKVVGEAVVAMSEINDASKKIADIIGVIDEIAFQTNLLALNASVEAARAGEQGRGFAVVASEVRNLAGRSATAAKEIKELIEDSVGKVEEGSKLVNKSGETLNLIVDSVNKVTDIISEISSSSQEQASGIEQVNNSIMQMDDMTQQNAALVEQAAAASESMNREASSLLEQVSFFSIEGGYEAANDEKDITQEEFVERRSSDRPWSKPVEQDQQVQATSEGAMQAAVGSDLDDEEWQEF